MKIKKLIVIALLFGGFSLSAMSNYSGSKLSGSAFVIANYRLQALKILSKNGLSVGKYFCTHGDIKAVGLVIRDKKAFMIGRPIKPGVYSLLGPKKEFGDKDLSSHLPIRVFYSKEIGSDFCGSPVVKIFDKNGKYSIEHDDRWSLDK